MKKIYTTIVFSLILILQLQAQSGGIGMWLKSAEKQGDWYFQNYAYQDAVDAYQKASAKEKNNDFLKVKVAESFRRLNRPTEAEEWFSMVKAKDSVFQTIHLLHYADALSSTGKYREAQLWYHRYQQQEAEDSRAGRKLEGYAIREELEHKNKQAVQVSSLGFNSPVAEFSPAYYQQGMVFVSGRIAGKGEQFMWDKSAFLDLFYQVTADTLAPRGFSDQINSPYHEGPAVFFQDDSRIVFTRNNYDQKMGKSSDGVTKLKLYYSEKKDSLSWTSPVPLPFNSDEFSTGHPAITTDGTVLYFASDRPGGYGGTDLYKSAFVDGQWQEPVNLGSKINTEGNEMFPFLQQNRYLYFASNGHAGLGGLDIYGLDLNLGESAEIINPGAPLNSRFDDFGLITDEDALTGFFSSNRQGGAGNDDIYAFKSKKPILSSYLLSGKILEEDGKAIAGAVVHLKDGRNNLVDSLQTGQDGSYSFKVEPHKDYQLLVGKEEYLDMLKRVRTLQDEGPEWIYDLRLRKNMGYNLYALILDENSGEPISDVQVILTDNMEGKVVLDKMTGPSGDFSFVLEDKKPKDRISFQVRLVREGYLGKTVTYNAELGQPGQINLHELMKVGLSKIDLGIDIGKLGDVKPIYFDLGRYRIRPDAAAELDKIVAIMKENPNIHIELGSHTDARGSGFANLQLSGKRAQASADYIISKGIKKSRITARGYGELEIMNRCIDGVSCSEEEHQQNRRTEFKVTKF